MSRERFTSRLTVESVAVVGLVIFQAWRRKSPKLYVLGFLAAPVSLIYLYVLSLGPWLAVGLLVDFRRRTDAFTDALSYFYWPIFSLWSSGRLPEKLIHYYEGWMSLKGLL